MSTDKPKPGNWSKASKVNYKQKSILDSFTIKSIPKVIASKQPFQKVAGVNDLQIISSNVEGPNNSLESQQSSKTNLATSNTALLRPKSTQVVDLTLHSDTEIEIAPPQMKEKTHSLSVHTLDVDSIPEPEISIYNHVPLEKPQGTGDGRTRDQPIIIPSSSPVKGSNSIRPTSVHPFFAPKSKPQGIHLRPFAGQSTTPSLAQDPPFPDGEFQHVKGPQTVFTATHEKPSFKRFSPSSRTVTMPEQNMNYAFLKQLGIMTKEHTDASNTWIYRTPNIPNELDIPQEHANHPAIARLVNDGPNNLPKSSRPWADKWRPSCAREVLGNEDSATYLRNWLRALELQLENGDTDSPAVANSCAKDTKGKLKASTGGKKRARVVRAVEKLRKRSRLDSDEEDESWIVDTDESEEEVNYEEIDEFGDILPSEVPETQPYSTQDTLRLPSQNAHQDLGQLHNTILLSGPSGSGKTTCVYACTEELGWDVFEVYPGVGRRNGANVDNLVGEVGKNHLVLQSRRNGDTMKTFLSQKKTDAEDDSPKGYHIASYSPRKKNTYTHDLEPTKLDNPTKSIRQSLILLEEVDILFKEDVNFWQTVIQIIKECKRPVICTCNDISLVPLEDLPLQTVIHFETCPSDVGVSYLQALCSAEGYSVGRDTLSHLSASLLQNHDSQRLDVSDRLDLRRTLNHLQMRCTTTTDCELRKGHIGPQESPQVDCEPELSPDGHPPSEPRISIKESENFSYLDSSLIGDTSNRLAQRELARYLPSPDDEIGHTVLYDIYAADKLQYGDHDRHEDMICSAMELSRRVFDVHVRESDMSGKSVEEMRKKRRHKQLTVMKEICPAATWTRGFRLWMEYLPYVRQMVESEDGQEAREVEKGREKGRRTRNSGRSEYIRTIELSGEGRRDLTESGFNHDIVEGT